MKSTLNKINFKALFFFPLIILALFFTACQDEESEIINPTNEETIIPNSNLANLMLNTATRDGSYDNIIDFANCLSIELPVTIIVNDITITINSVEDLELIEAILEQFDNDNDEIEIQFPIIIISSDYSEIVINNQEELEALIEECSGENEEDDDIECIDFQYPITISIYNSDFQVIDTIEINSDEELYMFIENLEGGILASLNFPVTMVLANGETIEVNNNEELEIAISEAIDDCDEDDDNDYDDDDEYDCPDLQANVGDVCEATGANELGIINTNCECQENTTTLECVNLQECYWYVDTNLYNTFVAEQFYFGANNVVEIINEETNQLEDIGNYWVNVQPNGSQTLTFIFNQEPHDLISLEWGVVVCDEGIIELVHENDILVLSQECDTTFDCPDLQANIGDVCETGSGVVGTINANCDCEENTTTLECTNLLECLWEIAAYNTNPEFIGFEFEFYANNEFVILQENQIIGDGTWTVTSSGDFIIIDTDFENLGGDWQIIDCSDGRIELMNNQNIMVIERICPNDFDCPDLQANVGDECVSPSGEVGVINVNCDCEVDDTTFDCPDLEANIGDICFDNQNRDGVVNENCECEIDDTNFDCPDLQANIGDECVSPSGEVGVINANCDCEVDDTTFDCPDLQANVGDECVSLSGEVGVINANCDCEVDDTTFDCPDLQANVGDVCFDSQNRDGVLNENCECEVIDTCSELDIDAYLLECVWYIVNYNGDNHLITFEFDFNDDGSVIISGENQVITAMWSTSEGGGAGVIVEFGNVNGGDIQAITGNWVIVECNSGRLEMYRDNDMMVMEQDCN